MVIRIIPTCVSGSMGSGEFSTLPPLASCSHRIDSLTSVFRKIADCRICFDGGSSFSGYGKLGFDRRVRIYDISAYGETISTYKRLSSGDIIDKQVLVGEGAPAGAGI